MRVLASGGGRGTAHTIEVDAAVKHLDLAQEARPPAVAIPVGGVRAQ
jgi:hypothetical protein